MAGEFDKDFGYLMPFINKVVEAANRVTDEAARAELLELVGGQQQRWARIREILSGSAPGPAPSTLPARAEAPARKHAPAGAAVPTRAADAGAAKQSFTRAETKSFTVGSLRPGRR